MRKLHCKLSFLLCIVFVFTVLAACAGKTPAPVVYVTETSVSLRVGESFKLGALASDGSAVRFASGNESVAAVDDGGVITAKAVGTAVVMVSIPSAMKKCEVTVTEAAAPPPASVTLSLSSASLYVGDELSLTAVVPNGEQVSYISTDTIVASVDGKGVVKALAAGSATIRARITGALASCDITVKALPTGGGTVTPTPDPDPDKDPDTPDHPSRTLVWSDEFNGTRLDTNKWGYQLGTQDNYNGNYGPIYWGNDEMQYYTQDAVKVKDGALTITAKKEKESRPDGRTFSSGRILTRDKFSRTFGYFEARIKSPAISGMWPAFWMLPQACAENDYGGWAANGEIDIMEAKGRLQNKVDTTIHFGGQWPDNKYLTNEYQMSSNVDEWHTYAVDWRAEYLAWYVDGVQVYKLTNDRWDTTSSSAPSAPFDKPFYILLNLACEGKYDPGATVPSGFDQASMYVDYVRVYE